MKENIFYKVEKNESIRNMIYCLDHGEIYTEEIHILLWKTIGEIIEEASKKGFYGNIWKCIIFDFLVGNENAYALSCERKGAIQGTLGNIVENDFENLAPYYFSDFSVLKKNYPLVCLDALLSFSINDDRKIILRKSISKKIVDLSASIEPLSKELTLKNITTQFYKENGVGDFGYFKAFRINIQENKECSIVPIRQVDKVLLDNLVGYDIPKRKLMDNTEAFMEGKPANNCLLFGDAGTGKSSSVKAILNTYYREGLRIIEIYKHQFQYLQDIISVVRNRNYKFIIYMDDLSFEDFEIEYKYLKCIIEGGLENKPDNVLIYATSNRRHIIRENYSDREEIREDMHTSDTVQEKLSLVARFGVSIFFCAPNKQEFQKIVTTLAKRYHMLLPEGELLAEANKWELSHGGLSGRTAQQFIDYMRGKREG